MKNQLRSLLGWAVAALLTVVASPVWGQGLTSASMNGAVTNAADGSPIVGATVRAVHTPSGTISETTTRAGGLFNLRGLRVGGPYSVTIEATAYETGTADDIFLALQEDRSLTIALGALPVAELDTFEVVASSGNLTFDTSRTTAGSELSSSDIANLPTIRRSITDIARLDPRITIDRDRGEIIAGGTNNRYNNITLDGSSLNDPFGLNASGLASMQGTNPVSFETIEGGSIKFADPNPRFAGYTGARIDFTTKKGTNDFSGAVYYIYTDEELRAENPFNGSKEEFRQTTRGATLSGPIWTNTAFFFVNYELFERVAPANIPAFVPTLADAIAIRDRAVALGYDPGFPAGVPGVASDADELTDDKLTAQFDVNIGARHRLSLRVSTNEGAQPRFTHSSGGARVAGASIGSMFSGSYWDEAITSDSYSAQWFADWTANFSTEARVTYSEYESKPTTRAGNFPAVTIENVAHKDGGTSRVLFLGVENSRQTNELKVETSTLFVAGTYNFGDRTVDFGIDYEGRDYFNNFRQNSMGSYVYRNATDWVNNATPRFYEWITARPGYTDVADFSMGIAGFFTSATWRVNDQLTLIGGLRLDYPMTDDKPVFNQQLLTDLGIRNDYTIDGNYILQPRMGINWTIPGERKTQIRAVAGLFRGTNPAVWLSNTYTNNGVTRAVYTFTSSSSSQVIPGYNGFVADPANQPTPGPYPLANVDLITEDFKIPSDWMVSIGVDHELPWLNMTATVGLEQAWVEDAVRYRDVNLRPAGTAQDGRPLYTRTSGPSSALGRSVNFTQIYELSNTSNGERTQFNVSLERKADRRKNFDYGFQLAYTYSRGTEVNPGTSSTASSNWGNMIKTDPNDDSAATSNYVRPHRFIAKLDLQWEMIRDHKSELTLFWESNTGRPYTWAFGGGDRTEKGRTPDSSNPPYYFGDVNGDGGGGNDAFYVPSGPGDVSFADPDGSGPLTALDAQNSFFAMLDATPELNKYRGRVVERNSEFADMYHFLDLSFTQELPIFRKLKSELGFTISNLGNLLNDDWGRYSELLFPHDRTVTVARVDNGRYTYYWDPRSSRIEALSLRRNDSRWQIQVEARIKF